MAVVNPLDRWQRDTRELGGKATPIPLLLKDGQGGLNTGVKCI